MGGEVALIGGELLFVGDFVGRRVESALLKTERMVAGKTGLGHLLYEKDFGRSTGLEFHV